MAAGTRWALLNLAVGGLRGCSGLYLTPLLLPRLEVLPSQAHSPRRQHDSQAYSFAGSLHTLTEEERRRKVLPVAWVHVPKVGATFMNAVLHLPGVCPGLPAGALLCSDRNPKCIAPLFALETGGYDMSWCPRICSGGISRFASHKGFNQQYLSGMKGHGFIMLRQAEQRLLSGYYNEGDHHGWHVAWGEPKSIRQYAEVVQGAAVKQLTRDGDHFWWGPPRPEETLLALRRLREGFAFVGITEEQELSICLLHRMFGGPCRPEEVWRFHPSRAHRSHDAYDTSALQGFRDVHDGALYQEALHIFRENLRLYNASPQSCGQCFHEARVTPEQLQHVGEAVGNLAP